MYLLLERVAMQPARCWERSAQIYWPPTVAVSAIASESPACVFHRPLQFPHRAGACRAWEAPLMRDVIAPASFKDERRSSIATSRGFYSKGGGL